MIKEKLLIDQKPLSDWGVYLIDGTPQILKSRRTTAIVKPDGASAARLADWLPPAYNEHEFTIGATADTLHEAITKLQMFLVHVRSQKDFSFVLPYTTTLRRGYVSDVDLTSAVQNKQLNEAWAEITIKITETQAAPTDVVSTTGAVNEVIPGTGTEYYRIISYSRSGTFNEYFEPNSFYEICGGAGWTILTRGITLTLDGGSSITYRTIGETVYLYTGDSSTISPDNHPFKPAISNSALDYGTLFVPLSEAGYLKITVTDPAIATTGTNGGWELRKYLRRDGT